MSIPFRERNPVPIGAVGLLVIALTLFLAFNVQSLPLVGGGAEYRPPSPRPAAAQGR